MKGFFTMLRMNIKLLLRNPGYLVSLIVIPVLAVLMLNIQYTSYTYVDNEQEITFMEPDTRIVAESYSSMQVLIRDNSSSDAAQWVARRLSQHGIYQIYICMPDSENPDAAGYAKSYMNNNTVSAVIEIPASFEEDILSGGDGGIRIFHNDDMRVPMLEEGVNRTVSSLMAHASGCKTAGALRSALEKADTSLPEETLVSIDLDSELSGEEIDYKRNIGFSVAILSFAFLMCGTFNAAVAVGERNNRVLTRIYLSGTGMLSYVMVKAAAACVTALIQTVVAGIGVCILTNGNIGIPFISYLFLLGGLALIFNLLCVTNAILSDNVLTAACTAFIVWTGTNLISGVYFSGVEITGWISRAAFLAPQKWVMFACDMIFKGQNHVYPLYLVVTTAFIIVIISVGMVGLKVRAKD